eukprot:CAMPEP_0115005372 /NCGR_PEP_ID=MMETSP0216-20121206/19820_1 /TAXON_ID=223996 /ORGANISM="Protocruzia adherens, Strain Boccale" /LENGTH=188 /DNA_ID=CAMNT_0002371661 /DNA_START=735 /DNA_END=1301 /DNA_ORIENTATION=+
MKCREKQKSYTVTLEAKNQKLAEENGKLSLENASLKAENALLRRQMSFFENMMANFPMMRKRESYGGDMESMGYPPMKGGFNDGFQRAESDNEYKAYMPSNGFGGSSFMFVVAFICLYMMVSAFDDTSAINPDWTSTNRHLSFSDSGNATAPANGSTGSNLLISLVGTAILGGLFVGYKTYQRYSKTA